MSTILTENGLIVKTQVDGCSFLSSELTMQMGESLEVAEDFSGSAVVLVHVTGLLDSSPPSLWPGETTIQHVTKWERILRRIERANVQTIVLVEGLCSSIALELLLVADWRLAVGQFKVNLTLPRGSVWPSMALYRLSRQIGEARIRKLYLSGIDLNKEVALELGIIDNVVDDLAAGLSDIERFLARAPLRNFAVSRRLIQDSQLTEYQDALGVHLAACERVLRGG